MSKRSLVRCAFLSVATATIFGLLGASAIGADPTPIAARMDTFSHPDKNSDGCFALSLKPDGVAPIASPHDVVVLFNTSASQTGEYRAKAIEVVKGLLAGLTADDRVQLMAVDLHAVPLTKTFVAPGSRQMSDALAALDARVPLGATDMAKAINAAVDSLAGESKNPRTVVYIGDGRSAANLLETSEFQKLTEKLVNARVSVDSYAVGLRTDPQLLGALAVQSGGTVISDNGALTGKEAGNLLAAAANATVLWPTSVAWPAGMTEVYPKKMPPLRSDRETVVIGTFKGKEPLDIQVTADSAAGPQKLSFAVPPNTPDDIHNYLLPLVEQARVDGGITLPLVGSESLSQARQIINAGVRGLNNLARQALAADNLDNAEKLVSESLRRDPNDPEAVAIKSALARRRQGAAPAAAGVAAAPAQPAPDQPPAGGATDLNLIGAVPDGLPAGAMADIFQHDQRVIAQVIQAEVQNAVNQARSLMGTDPAAATQQLKLTLEKVRQAPELNPDVRDQFVDVLQAALREASRRKIEVEQVLQQRQENTAAARERILVNENLLRNQQKVKQLMERFNSLMNEGRYRFAEEAAAQEAQKLEPNNPIPILATHNARIKGYYENFMAIRVARQKGVVDALYQSEKAHIPFPDEPPIVYPDAEVWQELTARRKEKYSSMDLAKRGTAEKKIDDALKSPTTLEFIETPLEDVIGYLKDVHKIEIQIDARALDDVGIGTDTPVTKNLKGISLRSALRLTLRELGLTYVIQDEVLLITTPEEADNRLSTKVYPVADLVLPITQMSPMGGGMMGGMGGGMGMFNVPRELLPKVPAGGFQAFAVKDDLGVEVPATVDNQPAKIEIEIEEGAKPEVVWDQYFSKNEPKPAAVRDAVRRLMNRQKFDHVIALTGAALRHHQGQPWMYEAMALALDAAGRPKAEIERAVMSAVDFVDNSADLMYIGAYLSQIGLHQRALQIYRQAANLDPVRPEPYMLGLRAARTLDDLDGLKWASLGILGQAWPKEQNHVWQAGVGVAREVLDKLRSEKRTKEADEFEAALDQAIQRDCVAIVTWTGEADVDVLVEEPSGTVCSLRNARTTSGGVMLGNEIRQTGRDSFGGHSEVYVCPKGFDGTYRMLVRRVWGDVTTGKVNVEVITHLRAPNSVKIRKRISIDKDEALVSFNLEGGRRTEPLHERQVANAIGGQIALNRQILAQQLDSAVDSRSLLDMALSRAASNSNGSPYYRRGAVGYQPVITVLPEGANLGATAVISADRRYVRITCAPMFSGIAEVNVFNTASGENTSGQGGTGGQGFSGQFGGGTGGGNFGGGGSSFGGGGSSFGGGGSF